MPTQRKEVDPIFGALTSQGARMYLNLGDNALKRIPPSELPYFTINARGDRRYRMIDLERFIERRLVDK